MTFFADNIDGAIIAQPVIAVTADVRVRCCLAPEIRRGAVWHMLWCVRLSIYARRNAGAYVPGPGVEGYRGRLVSLWTRSTRGWEQAL